MINNCVACGNLVQDPELRKTQNDKSVVNFTIAVNEGKDKAEFIPCQAWDKNAENIAQYLLKGSQVIVRGKFRTRKWEDNQGIKRQMSFIDVAEIQFTSRADKPKEDFNYPREFNQPTQQPMQQNITGTNQDVLGFEDTTQKNGYVDIKTDDLPFINL